MGFSGGGGVQSLSHVRLFNPMDCSTPGLPTAKALQSCPTLCDPRDGSPPGSPVPGNLQARTLEWVAISFSNAWKWTVKVKSLSRVWSSGPHGLQPTRLLCPWDFPGKSTGVGCHCLLLIYPEETKIEKDTCIPLFIAALFTISRTWKQPRCPSTDEWTIIEVVIYIHNEILLSRKKEHLWVSSNEVDEPRTYYTEWSESERER